jgi:hypothetical protein
VSGLTNVIVGVLALTWPAVTVLPLAVIFGLRMIVLGIGQIVLGFKMRSQNAKYIRGLVVRRIVTHAIDPAPAGGRGRGAGAAFRRGSAAAAPPPQPGLGAARRRPRA